MLKCTLSIKTLKLKYIWLFLVTSKLKETSFVTVTGYFCDAQPGRMNKIDDIWNNFVKEN